MSEEENAIAAIAKHLPEKSLGRLADSVSDVISPASEALGWLGDVIGRHRKESSARIVEEALKLKDISTEEIVPSSIKSIASVMQNGSLEDPNSELISTWARLLVTEIDRPNPRTILFSEILAKLNRHEIIILEALYTHTMDTQSHDTKSGLETRIGNAVRFLMVSVERELKDIASVSDKELSTLSIGLDANKLDRPWLMKAIKLDNGYGLVAGVGETKGDLDLQVSIEILLRLGLVVEHEVRLDSGKGDFMKQVPLIITISELGARFAAACRGEN